MSGLDLTLGLRHISPNSALQDPSGRPAPSGLLLPLMEEGEREIEFRIVESNLFLI